MFYKWGFILLGGILCSSCGVSQGIPASRESLETTRLALTEYLREADDQVANRLKETLSKRPLPELKKAFRSLNPPDLSQTRSPFQRSIQSGNNARTYSVHLPAGYSRKKAYPVAVVLHGTGFSGENYINRWIPRLGSRYILVCPTFEMGEWWSREAEAYVIGVIKDILLSFSVDSDRVFLGGMSSGGVGTFLIGLNHPDLFAGLFPMAGAFPKPLFPLLDNLQSTPMYLVHGEKDLMMPPILSRAVEQYMKKHDLKIVYREHSYEHPQAGGHFFPEEETQPLVEWMNKQKRPSKTLSLTSVHDRDHLGRQGWVRIRAVDGVASFWASYRDRSEGEAIKAGHFARFHGELGKGNVIKISSARIKTFDLLLSDDLVNFKKPIKVEVNGEIEFEGRVDPDVDIFLEEARHWPDPQRAVWGSIPIDLSSQNGG